MNKTTLRSLDGGGYSPPDDMNANDHWYLSVCEIPLVEMHDGDLACALRLTIHVDGLLPVAVPRVVKDPLAGRLNPGELAEALALLPRRYWEASPQWREVMRAALPDILEALKPWPEVQAEVAGWQGGGLKKTE